MEYAQDIIIQNEGKVMEKEVMIVAATCSFSDGRCFSRSGFS